MCPDVRVPSDARPTPNTVLTTKIDKYSSVWIISKTLLLITLHLPKLLSFNINSCQSGLKSSYCVFTGLAALGSVIFWSKNGLVMWYKWQVFPPEMAWLHVTMAINSWGVLIHISSWAMFYASPWIYWPEILYMISYMICKLIPSLVNS